MTTSTTIVPDVLQGLMRTVPGVEAGLAVLKATLQHALRVFTVNGAGTASRPARRAAARPHNSRTTWDICQASRTVRR
ncbi:hypothetical protein H8R17_44310 [Streptomyces sp. TRM68367]|nr:hypothetical protein [Streptomyces sp. TRM68367]